jgi:hypothetical protein
VTNGTKKNPEDKFVPLPVDGDSRDDNPPRGIRNNKGLNYYYQGKTDVYVLGALHNEMRPRGAPCVYRCAYIPSPMCCKKDMFI